MVWLPDGEKISKISSFVLTECTNVTDTQTDRQTPHDDIGRACRASRGKKLILNACKLSQQRQRFKSVDKRKWQINLAQASS